MKKIALVLGLVVALGIVFTACQKSSNNKIVIPKTPFKLLSEYNFFAGKLSNLTPADRVLPYDLNSSLFSDYAHKARFVWMPEGSKAIFTEEGVLDFPNNSVLIKNFYYNHDESDLTAGRKIIETRLLVNRESEWEAISYIWDENQTDAKLEVIGDIQDVQWINKMGEKQSVTYIVPNKNQCKTCHVKGKKQIPIGPKSKNLNKTYDYADGMMNQLVKWSEIGYLSELPSMENVPKVANWEDEKSHIQDRALAYLDINCGHCHNKEGSANTSGLHLLSDAALDINLGIYKATVSAGAGTGGHTYSIVPGASEESIIIYRMNSNNPGAMMPELGRSTVHKEGVELIANWIDQLEPDAKTYSTSLQ